jgi:hypothetical protein
MLQPFPSFLDVSRSFAGRMRDERGQTSRTRGAIGGDACVSFMGRWVGFIACTNRIHGWTSPAHLLEAGLE